MHKGNEMKSMNNMYIYRHVISQKKLLLVQQECKKLKTLKKLPQYALHVVTKKSQFVICPVRI